MKRSPAIGAATGLALSSITAVGLALSPAQVSASSDVAPVRASAPATPEGAVNAEPSTSPAPLATTTLTPSATTWGGRAARASRSQRAAHEVRQAALKRKLAAARAVEARAARQQAALKKRITSGAASVTETKAWTRKAVTERGWSAQQFSCLDRLWTLESEWDHKSMNPSSGAYGIPQALPARKMAAAGDDWRTNIDTQIRWGLRYIKARYDTPCNAWAHSRAHNWY